MSQEVSIRRLEPEDAASLKRCFERCYGSTYPSSDFYDTELLRSRIEAGSLRSVVATDEQSQVVGHTGLTVRQPELAKRRIHQARAAVAGNTVVDPDFRGQGVLGKLGRALHELCNEDGFVGYVHFPTTAHTIMQKRSVESGGIETGIQLAYIPATTDYRAVKIQASDHRRLAVTVVYQPLARAPLRKVYFPARYADLMAKLYRQADLKRLPLEPPSTQPRLSSQLSFEVDSGRGLLRIEIERSGQDLEEQIDVLLRTYSDGGSAGELLAILHADLFLDDPHVDHAVQALLARGFFYAGLAPELAHTDILRLQRLQPVEDFHPWSIDLANSEATVLLEILKRDSETHR